MELISIGFLAGAIFAVIVCGAGIIYGRHDNGQSNTDTDVRVYVPMRRRRGGGNYGHTEPMEPEEVTAVLYLFRIGATAREKQVIDYLIDKEERENTHEEQNQA